MSYNIFTSDHFDKELKKLAKKYPSLKSDFKILIESLKDKPIQGQPLGKDCFKVRMAITSKNKGKSSGSRVITCVKVLADYVFLLSIYDKSEKDNMDDNELDILLGKAGLL